MGWLCSAEKESSLMDTDFETWKRQLAVELAKVFGMPEPADSYVTQCGDECWREMYDDGLSPADAAYEEANASIGC
jgi:hypothetical protein